MCTSLLSAGARLVPDEGGLWPLHNAAQRCVPGMVQALLNAKAEVCRKGGRPGPRDSAKDWCMQVNRQDKDGDTALHMAVAAAKEPLCCRYDD